MIGQSLEGCRGSSVGATDKSGAEAILLEELLQGVNALPAGQTVMIKVTIPENPDLYAPLVNHPRVTRVVALSGGYSLHDACQRLAKNHGIIASFSRALLDDLRNSMTDAQFDATLAAVVDQIYAASTIKH